MADITIRLPTKTERWGLAIMGISAVLMWILAWGMFENGIGDKVSWLAGLQQPAINLFWIMVVIYHIGLFLIATRSIILNGKNTIYDGAAFIIGILGIICVIVSIVGFYYFKFDNITWFFNIKQQSLFYIGVVLEAITASYYALTE